MKKQVNEAYILRAIACLAVIFVHISAIPLSTLLPDSLHMKIFSLLNRSAKFTTPTFIFISGLTLFYSYRDKKLDYIRFYKKRLTATILPYILWTFIYYQYFIYEEYHVFSWDFLIEKLLWADMSYHLYFILTILQFYLLFGVFLYCFKKFNPNIVLAILLIISLFTVKYIRFEYVDRFFARYVFFFGLGCYTAINLDTIREKLWKHKYLIATGYIGISCYFGYQFYLDYALDQSINNFTIELTWFAFCFIAIMFYYILAYYIAKREDSGIYRTLKMIGRASYYIYLSHPLVIFLSEKWLTDLGMLSITRRFILNVIIVYGTTVPLSVCYLLLKNKLTGQYKDSEGKKVTLHRGT